MFCIVIHDIARTTWTCVQKTAEIILIQISNISLNALERKNSQTTVFRNLQGQHLQVVNPFQTDSTLGLGKRSDSNKAHFVLFVGKCVEEKLRNQRWASITFIFSSAAYTIVQKGIGDILKTKPILPCKYSNKWTTYFLVQTICLSIVTIEFFSFHCTAIELWLGFHKVLKATLRDIYLSAISYSIGYIRKQMQTTADMMTRQLGDTDINTSYMVILLLWGSRLGVARCYCI